MSWFKTDDKLPNHRKSRAVRKSHADKVRDVSPFGIWVLAGAWSDDGFVPLEVLEDWDDDAKGLATRLVKAGFWHATKRDGEPGYFFHDWPDHNPVKNDADPSASGSFGNHARWHIQRGVVKPDCSFCPDEPDEPGDSIGANRGDIAPDSEIDRGESLPSRPDPSRTRPEPDQLPRPMAETQMDRFDEFWDVYGKKVKRADAERKFAKALAKESPDRIIAAAAAYVGFERANNHGGRYIADPSTWLHGERWRDERAGPPLPQTRVQEHLTLVQQLAAEEATTQPRQIGDGS